MSMTSDSINAATTRLRVESDSIGQVQIPVNALYGVNTVRALDNFPFTARVLGQEAELVRAFGVIKQACAMANRSLGALPDKHTDLLLPACEDLRSGQLNEHLKVSMMEGSGGTSLNMNVNEVIANRGLQLFGYEPGRYERLNPNDHVNRSQSTNDVVPAAVQLACHELAGAAAEALEHLACTAKTKAEAFAGYLKLGRTCLQDAQPMTLGQTFGAYAAFAERSARRLRTARQIMLTLPLGATAIGTGFGAPAGFVDAVYPVLAELSDLDVQPPEDFFDAMSNTDGFVSLSGELTAIATGLGKIANDLVLLSSGPKGGLGELRLPEVQAGSSIMPGKVNPVIPMAVRQIAHSVQGHGVSVAAAGADGLLEINHFEPGMACALFSSLRLVREASQQLADACLKDVEPRPEAMSAALFSSSAMATGLSADLGHARVSGLARQADAEGRTFMELAVEQGLITRADAECLIRNSLGTGK